MINYQIINIETIFDNENSKCKKIQRLLYLHQDATTIIREK